MRRTLKSGGVVFWYFRVDFRRRRLKNQSMNKGSTERCEGTLRFRYRRGGKNLPWTRVRLGRRSRRLILCSFKGVQLRTEDSFIPLSRQKSDYPTREYVYRQLGEVCDPRSGKANSLLFIYGSRNMPLLPLYQKEEGWKKNWKDSGKDPLGRTIANPNARESKAQRFKGLRGWLYIFIK